MARYLRANTYPTASAWFNAPVFVYGEGEVEAWTVAHHTSDQPAVSVARSGGFVIGWTSHRTAHRVSAAEVLSEFGAGRVQQVLVGLEHLLSLPHPEVIGID